MVQKHAEPTIKDAEWPRAALSRLRLGEQRTSASSRLV
jgi:hypothetical protein